MKRNTRVTFAEFARSRGVSRAAVRKAWVRGRLDKSVVLDSTGRPCLVKAIADREWVENASRPTKDAR